MASLNTIFLEQRRSLMWTVTRIVRDPHIAEDLAQEAYLRVRKALESGPVEHIEAFLHHTARNLALDHIRHRSVRKRVEAADVAPGVLENVASAQPSLEHQLIQRERLRCYEEALDALPERAKRVWVLSRVEGWPYARIAEHLGVSPNTVFNDMKRAMAHCALAVRRFDSD